MAGAKTAKLARLLWPLVLGLCLILGALWALVPHSTVQAQVINPNFTVDIPHDPAVAARGVGDQSPPEAALAAPGVDADDAPSPPASGSSPLAGMEGTAASLPARPPMPLPAPLLTPPMAGDADLAACLTTDRVWGVVGAGDTVTVTVNATQRGAARADGNGFFWTTLYDTGGSRPGLTGGDVVRIYRNGVQTATVTLRSITGRLNSVSNVVSGTIGGVSSPISVTVYAPADRPLAVAYTRTVSTDASGVFTADFTGTVDFWGDAFAVVSYVEDGVEVQGEVYARELVAMPWPLNDVRGYTDPGAAVTMTLQYSDTTTKQQMTGVADPWRGRYQFSVPTGVLASDIVVVEIEGGTTLSREVESLTVNVDAANDLVTGQAPAGARVSGQTDRLTSQGYPLAQTSTTADASGIYTLDFGGIADIMPGSWAGVDVVDAEGDDLDLWAPSPGYVEVDQTWNSVYGRAVSPPGPLSEGWPVTLTLYSASDDTINVYSKGMGWYGDFGFSEGDGLPDIAPGDVVTVESESFAWQGIVNVMTMTAQHDLDADRFTGTVVTPTSRVELSAWQWQNWPWSSRLYPVGGSFDMLITATSPFTGSPAGFDARNGIGYWVAHRTTDENVEGIYREVDWIEVNPGGNGLEALFYPPGTAYTITLYDGSGSQKAQMDGTTNDPIGNTGWRDFKWSGQQIEIGDRVQVQGDNGFSQTVVIPAFTVSADAGSDLVSGQGPANTLLYVEVQDQGRGFVPTDDSGQFAVIPDQLQEIWGDGDLQWGNWVGAYYFDENNNRVRAEFQWPRITANYDMEGENNVWGENAFPGNTIYITITHPLSGVVATGTTTTGTCDWCGPTEYRLDFPAGTIVPSNTVTVDFGDGFVDSVDVVTITATPDVNTDIVTGTAPANGWLSANADCINGGCWSNIKAQADATGVYTLNFWTEGDPPHDIQYGDRFNVQYDAPRGHEVQYSFWIPAPELQIEKQNTSGMARPGGSYLYRIRYRNQGNGTAENTLITDTLPPSTTYATDTSGFAVEDGGNVITWTLGDVLPNTDASFYVALNVDPAAPTQTNLAVNCAAIATTSPGDYDPGNNEQCSGEVWVDESDVGVWVNKGPSPDDPHPGQQFAYHIDYGSDRSAASGPVWLTDTLPASTTFVSWDEERDWDALWTEVVTAGGQFVLYAPGGIPGDMGGHIRLTLRLGDDVPISTTLENSIVITTAGDVDPGNNQQTNTDAHVSPSRYDMRVDKSFNNGILAPGGRLNYHIYYENRGNMATQAWITDTLPSSTSYRLGSARWENNGPPFPPVITGDTVVWDLGVVEVNRSYGFDFELDVSGSLTPNTVLTNCATVGITATEDNLWDNTDCDTQTIYDHGPNLRTRKSHEWQNNNRRLRYEVVFENAGDETVAPVVLTDTYPVSTTRAGDPWWDFWRNINWTDNYTDNQLIFQIEELDPGWTARLWFEVDLDDPDARPRWYTNTVEIDTPPDDVSPADNTYTDVAVKGEVERVELWVNPDGDSHMWGQAAPNTPVTVTTVSTQVTAWADGGGNWNMDNVGVISPGDVITVEAGGGLLPVVIPVPDPFSAQASSLTGMVWGQIGGWTDQIVEVHGDWPGGYKEVPTDASGVYTATYGDVPRGADGYVRYVTQVDYAEVIFHRPFQSPDLILTVNYAHDWVETSYAAGYTIWITVTDSVGGIKATMVDTTGVVPWWGGQTGFSTNMGSWSPGQPDIVPGDWVSGTLDGYTSTVHVGTINGSVDATGNSISGTINANWFTQLLSMRCEVWVENGPDSINASVNPNGGSYQCDFDDVGWDLLPGQDVAVTYSEPDNDQVINVFQAPAIQVNYGHDWVDAHYEAGHTVWITLTNGGGALKNTAVLTTGAVPSWGGGTGFSTNWQGWASGQPDIVPGDHVYVEIDDGYSNVITVGTISGYLDVGGNTVTGTVSANFTQTLNLRCEVWVNNGPDGINTTVDPDGSDVYQCDFDGVGWDLLPGQDVAVRYYEPDNDEVINVFREPAPDMRVEKWVDGNGEAAPGGPTVFNIRYQNQGDGAGDAILTDTLPLSTSYVWDSSGFPAFVGSGVVTWSLGTVQPYTLPVQFQLVLTNSANASDTLHNDVDVDALYETNPDNNHAEAEIHIADEWPDLYVNKKPNPGDPAPGQLFRYDINYGNQGPVAGGPVWLTDTLPASTTFVSWESENDYNQWTEVVTSGEQVVLSATALPGNFGDRIYLTLRLDDDVPYDTQLVNTVEITTAGDSNPDDNFQLNDQAWSRLPRYDSSAEKWWGDGSLVPGAEVNYWIGYRNSGNSLVHDTVLTDTLPDGVDFITSTLDLGWGVEVPFPPDYNDGDQLAWYLGDLEVNERQDIRLRLQIDSGASPGDVLTNCATTSISDFEDDPYNNTECVTDTVRAAGPNLGVIKSANWEGTGNNIRYDVAIRNIGTTTEYSVTITDTYPSAMTLNWCNFNFWEGWQWSGCAPGTNPITITLSRLEPGWTVWLKTGLSVPGVANGTLFTNTAEIDTPPGDVNPDDNRAEVVVGTGPELSIEKWLTGGTSTPGPGDLITYTLHFKNNSEWGTAGNVLVTDTLPAGLEFVSAQHDPNYNDGTTLVWWDYGQMCNGCWNDFVVTVRVSNTVQGGAVLTNSAEIASSEPVSDTEPYYDNNASTYIVTASGPSFTVTKTYTSSRVAGAVVTYTVTATNTGNETGNNVVLSDTLPISLTYGGSDGTFDGTAITWTFASIAPDNMDTGWFSATLPCTSTVIITNDDYRVVASDEGAVSPAGEAVSFETLSPTITANITHTLGTIVVSDTVHFTATVSTNGGPLSYQWDFGDGPTSGVLTASHVYTRDGAYTVIFTATDTCGYSQAATTSVTVNPPNLVADFGQSATHIVVGTTVYFYDFSDTDGPPIAARWWTFGDGGTSSAQNPGHKYTTAGVYTVTLLITDSLDYTATRIVTDAVTVATPSFEVGKVYAGSGVAKTVVTYTLTVTNTGDYTGTGVVLSDTLPANLTYGGSDGTKSGNAVTWTFDITPGGKATGWFSATLPCTGTVANNDYRVVTSTQGVTSSPGVAVSFETLSPTITANVTHTLGAIVVSDTVHFTATVSTDGGPLSYQWDFGDGPTGGGLAASHVYTRDGAYTVIFTATDDCSYNQVATASVTVNPPDLVAGFDQSATWVVVGTTVTFTDTSDTDGPPIAARWWTFGDGGTSSAQDPGHKYTTAGVYTVTLLITDTLGYTATHAVTDAVTVATPQFEVGKVYAGSGVAKTVVTYTLTVTNTGDYTGTGVVLSDTLPTGLTYGGSDVGIFDGTAVTWTFASIAPDNHTATGWFSATLPCTGTVANNDYRVVTSTQGVTSEAGAAVSFGVLTPTLNAAFNQSAASVAVSTTVYFTDTSTTNGPAITDWEWDFGDSSAHATTQNASHVYDGAGTFTVTLTVTDTCSYSDVATSTVTVSAVSPASVTITGLVSGVIQSSYAFTATVTPITTTIPITYTWQATDKSVVTHTGGLSDTVSFSWSATGTKTITVTAANVAGMVTNTHVITINAAGGVIPRAYLPVILKNAR